MQNLFEATLSQALGMSSKKGADPMGSSKLSKVSLHLAEFLLCVCVYSDLGQLVLHMLIKQPVFVGVFLIQCIQMIYVCVCLCLCVFYSIHKQFCRQYACTVVGFPS